MSLRCPQCTNYNTNFSLANDHNVSKNFYSSAYSITVLSAGWFYPQILLNDTFEFIVWFCILHFVYYLIYVKFQRKLKIRVKFLKSIRPSLKFIPPDIAATSWQAYETLFLFPIDRCQRDGKEVLSFSAVFFK